MEPWQPEFEVDEERAARMCRAQFPERFGAGARARVLGTGWDNRAFRIADREGDDWVVRFPQREIAARLMEGELRFLPAVAERLEDEPIALPWPRLRGAAAEGYPWCFGGYRFLRGRTACAASVQRPEHRAGAATLAHFLGHLHGLGGVDGLEDLPTRDRILAPNPAGALERHERRIDELESRGAWPAEFDAREVRGRLTAGIADAAAPEELCPVHGDLYARHLLVDGEGAPTGVIDWGDLHLGDPAWDLSLAWTWFGGASRERFLSCYPRPLDQGLLQRARFRALVYGVILMHYGESIGDTAMGRLGVAALRGSLGSWGTEG